MIRKAWLRLKWGDNILLDFQAIMLNLKLLERLVRQKLSKTFLSSVSESKLII